MEKKYFVNKRPVVLEEGIYEDLIKASLFGGRGKVAKGVPHQEKIISLPQVKWLLAEGWRDDLEVDAPNAICLELPGKALSVSDLLRVFPGLRKMELQFLIVSLSSPASFGIPPEGFLGPELILATSVSPKCLTLINSNSPFAHFWGGGKLKLYGGCTRVVTDCRSLETTTKGLSSRISHVNPQVLEYLMLTRGSCAVDVDLAVYPNLKGLGWHPALGAPPKDLKNLEALECGAGHEIRYPNLTYLCFRYGGETGDTSVHGNVSTLCWPQRAKSPLSIHGKVKKLFIRANQLDSVSLIGGSIEELHLCGEPKLHLMAENVFYHTPREFHRLSNEERP